MQDQQVAQPVARVGAVPARLVGGERVAPPEAVEDPDDPVVVARDHSPPGRARARRVPPAPDGRGAGRRRTSRPSRAAPRAARTATRSSGSSSSPGATQSKRTPLRSIRRVNRRSWRSKSFDGAPVSGASGRATLGQASLSNSRAPAGSGLRRPARRGAAHEQRRAPQRRAQPGGHLVAEPVGDEPGGVVADPDAAAGVGPDRDRERDAAVQPLAVAAERDERLEATRTGPSRRRAACAAGRPAPPTRRAPNRASGSTSCRRRAARQLQPVAPQPASPATASRSRDLRALCGQLATRLAQLSPEVEARRLDLVDRLGVARPARRHVELAQPPVDPVDGLGPLAELGVERDRERDRDARLGRRPSAGRTTAGRRRPRGRSGSPRRSPPSRRSRTPRRRSSGRARAGGSSRRRTPRR